ncbi:hypothetical protein CEXT_436821 [Caerostris extrusa]|uniref:Uncharacterized protein n=1 Tax=Caerostris extrusa TaxID=172846 RepID=A0AAV4XH68_CAEEX|nr:hypothetical protein CEXT_436821 [Caerostris extrusa]
MGLVQSHPVHYSCFISVGDEAEFRPFVDWLDCKLVIEGQTEYLKSSFYFETNPGSYLRARLQRRPAKSQTISASTPLFVFCVSNEHKTVHRGILEWNVPPKMNRLLFSDRRQLLPLHNPIFFFFSSGARGCVTTGIFLVHLKGKSGCREGKNPSFAWGC